MRLTSGHERYRERPVEKRNNYVPEHRGDVPSEYDSIMIGLFRSPIFR